MKGPERKHRQEQRVGEEHVPGGRGGENLNPVGPERSIWVRPKEKLLKGSFDGVKVSAFSANEAGGKL